MNPTTTRPPTPGRTSAGPEHKAWLLGGLIALVAVAVLAWVSSRGSATDPGTAAPALDATCSASPSTPTTPTACSAPAPTGWSSRPTAGAPGPPLTGRRS